MNDPNISDSEILAEFQVLIRQNNLWKSRYCKHRVKIGNRGIFVEINYFYEGGPTWLEDIPDDDKRGCHSCFLYNPEKCRQSFNEIIVQQQKNNQSK